MNQKTFKSFCDIAYNIIRQKLVNEVYRMLKPGGYFFVGHLESLSALKHNFKTVAPAVYKK